MLQSKTYYTGIECIGDIRLLSLTLQFRVVNNIVKTQFYTTDVNGSFAEREESIVM